MLTFYSDCGFETEDELVDYVESLRDAALVADDDDAASSFEQDLSFSFTEITESIDGASLYIEYTSPKPLNEVKTSIGYEVEASIISPEIIFSMDDYIDEDEQWDDYWEDLQIIEGFPQGASITLKPGLIPANNSMLDALNYSSDFFLEDGTPFYTISVGLAKPGLNVGETDLSENKWAFRLFGKISGVVEAEAASEAKSKFADILKESFSFLEIYDSKSCEFLDEREKELLDDGEFWLIPIEEVFVNIRKKIT